MSKVTEYDYIIVGQGIGGTLLSWFLKQRGKSYYIIDNNHNGAASKIAAGIINPITGRKYVISWRIDDFLAFANQTYSEISKYLSCQIANPKTIYRSLNSIMDENTWEARKLDPVAGKYIVEEASTEEFEGKVNGINSFGVLKGSIQVKIPEIIAKFKSIFEEEGLIHYEKFDYNQLEISEDRVSYKNVSAKQIIFAEGYQSQHNPFFSYLPFEPAKGDVLIIRIEGNPFESILKHKTFIAPIDDNHYWVGSDYRWTFKSNRPNPLKKEEIIEKLDEILNVPYEIVSHLAGVRPCVSGRRPFLGKHHREPRISIFNGLGTKGASLGPYWANHMIEHLENDSELDEAVNIIRFDK